MRKAFLLSVFVPACLAFSDTANAQISVRKPQLGIFGGVSVPRGDFSQETDPGWNAGALFKVRVTRTIDARIDGTYTRFGTQSIEFVNAEIEATSDVTFGTLLLELNLGQDSAAYPGDNSVSPWINLGPGMYRMKFDATCVNIQSNICDGFVSSNEETSIGWTVGIGANVPFYRIPLFAEARYHRFGTVFPILADSNGNTATFFTISAGIKIR